MRAAGRLRGLMAAGDAQAQKPPSSAHRSGWLNLTWKLLLAVAILLLMSVGNPLSWMVAWGFLNPIPATLLLWGGLVAGVASANLFEGSRALRWVWGGLTVAAYLALTLPGLLLGADRFVDALGPVAALTLAAHLPRRDLQRALRDWALVMAISLYTALGVQAMWLVMNSFGNVSGPLVFLVAVLLPPLIFEAVLLGLRRFDRLRSSLLASVAGLLLATSLAAVVVSLTLFNAGTEPLWRVIFGVLVGGLIGVALLVGLLTRPLVTAASGARVGGSVGGGGINLARVLVELSHEPILISLAVYIPLRLLSFVGTQ